VSILIHVGYPKTGTTWFQTEFFPRVENINYYSKDDIFEILINPSVINYNAFEHRKMFNFNKIVIVSSERLIGTINSGWHRGIYLKEYASRIKEIFPNARILIFIRNQIDIITSAYIEYLKSGGTYGIDKYLFKYNNGLFSFEHLKYLDIINYYSDLFGQEKIDIFLFEDFKENPKSFINKFMARYKLQSVKDNINYNNKVNKSFHYSMIPLIRFLNIFSKGEILYKFHLIHIPLFTSVVRKLCLAVDSKLFRAWQNDPIKILKKRNYNYIINYYKESNFELIERYNLHSIRKYKYP